MLKSETLQRKVFFTPFADGETVFEIQILHPGEIVKVARVEDRGHFSIADVVAAGVSGSITFSGEFPWR